MHDGSLGAFPYGVKLRSSTFGHYLYIEREANEGLKRFCVAKVDVTLVTLVLVTSGLVAAGCHEETC
jgi:hypothetical protein